MEKLSSFIDVTLGGSLQQCDLTDADGALWTVQYIGGIETVREDGGGRVAAYERFSGQLTWRVVI